MITIAPQTKHILSQRGLSQLITQLSGVRKHSRIQIKILQIIRGFPHSPSTTECPSTQYMELIAHLILCAELHYHNSKLEFLAYQLHCVIACSPHQFQCPAVVFWAREAAAVFVVLSDYLGAVFLAGNWCAYWSNWSSFWAVLGEGWSLHSLGWISTGCLPSEDLFSGDLPLLPCYCIPFPKWNSWRPAKSEVKGTYTTGAAAVFLAVVPSTSQQWHYW